MYSGVKALVVITPSMFAEVSCRMEAGGARRGGVIMAAAVAGVGWAWIGVVIPRGVFAMIHAPFGCSA